MERLDLAVKTCPEDGTVGAFGVSCKSRSVKVTFGIWSGSPDYFR